MPEAEELYAQQLNQNRASQAKWLAKDRAQQAKTTETTEASFPWLMLFVAIIFDLIGMIPFINIVTDTIAGFILWLWKKQYDRKTNPIVDIIAFKIADYLFLGLLPSNTASVVYGYIKKKTASRISSLPTGALAKT